MIVVSDTSPLTALLAIGREDLLPELFHQVAIPEAVHAELLRAHTQLPGWVIVRAVTDHAEAARFAESVDIGEAEAIELARELKADLLLIDSARALLIELESRAGVYLSSELRENALRAVNE